MSLNPAVAREANFRRTNETWPKGVGMSGSHAAVEDRIAAVLRPRMPQRMVGEIFEFIYSHHAYYPIELAEYAKHPKTNHYRAEWHRGARHCGHNPSLHANYVHDLIIERDPETGIETISWVLSPRHQVNTHTMEREMVRGAIPWSITRTVTGPLSDRETGRST